MALCSFGIRRPPIGRAIFFAVNSLAGASEADFFVAGFFFAACFAGSGMDMPGMFICAIAGEGIAARASALAAKSKLIFTRIISKERRRFRTTPLPLGCFKY